MKIPTSINLGSDIIELLLDIHYPMFMVDTIKSFDSRLRILESIKMISSNEAVFQGHFPGLKLWPGIYTLEGLKQSILMYLALKDLESKDLLTNTIKLQSRRRNLSQPFSEDSHSAYTYIKENFPQKKFLYSFEVKFIAPVYSESIIHNHIFQSSKEKLNFEVSAFVKNKIVAKGEIRLEHK